jgi:hypothetical protein
LVKADFKVSLPNDQAQRWDSNGGLTMNSMRTRLNLRTLASARIARTNGLLTSIFAMALGATVIAGSTPALAAAQNDDPAVASTPAPTISLEEATAQHQTIKLVALIPEEESETPAPSTEGDLPFPSLTPNGSSAYTPLAADPDGETRSYYGTWTAYPYVHEFLVSFVAYNDYCEEITPGSWYEGSVAPKYGIVTQKHVKGKLSNGDCSDYIFTGAGIFYQWVDKTSSSRSDEFKANWKGAGMENKVTFYIKDKE